MLYQLPNVAQVLLADVLSDTEWVKQYLLHCNDALRQNCLLVRQRLDKLNLPYVIPQAGMFLWVDFSEFAMPSLQLYRLLLKDYRVFLTPG